MTVTYEAVQDAINSGALDSDLGKLNTLLQNRIETQRRSKTPNDFGIGDKVVFNSSCGTRYLIGHTARVVGHKRTKLVVTLDTPTGRFARVNPITRQVESAQITVPIAIVDPA